MTEGPPLGAGLFHCLQMLRKRKGAPKSALPLTSTGNTAELAPLAVTQALAGVSGKKRIESSRAAPSAMTTRAIVSKLNSSIWSS